MPKLLQLKIEQKSVKILTEFLKAEMVVFDVGPWIGYVALIVIQFESRKY